MRIGLVLPAVPSYSETFFVNKIKGLQSCGHEVVLFVNAKTSLRTFEGAKIKVSSSGSRNPIKAMCQFFVLVVFHFKNILKFYHLERKDNSPLLTILKRVLLNNHILSEQLDWLHFGFGTMALEKENFAEAIGAKMAVSFRGFDHYVYPVKNKNCYKLLFSKEVKYHVLSEGMKQSLINSGIRSENIIKITPAIDVDLFSFSEKKEDKSVVNFLTIARLHWIKGLEYSLQALAVLKGKGVNFHYTIVGDGPENERLKFAAHQLGLLDHVTFAGKLTPDEVKIRLQTATIYLQYSIQEGFCNAVLEAQAMGKLCIVSDAEGLSENVLNGVTGFVIAKRKPVSLAEQIAEVIGLPSEIKEAMIRKAVDRIKNEFAFEDQIKKIKNFYEDN